MSRVQTQKKLSRRVRRVLDRIDTILAENYDGGKSDCAALWDCITALRGPDSNDEREKLLVTAPLRARILPKCAKAASLYGGTSRHFGGGGFMIGPDADTLTVPAGKWWEHFYNHARRAAGWLGIEVIDGS